MPIFYFFFAAFTAFFAFAFLTIFNMKICLLLYKFMLVDLSYLPFTISNDDVSSERIAVYLTGIRVCYIGVSIRVRVDKPHYEENTEL